MNWRLTNFCEIDKYASKAYCAIHGVDESLNLGDITKVNPDEIGDFSMICGGSPCFVAGTQVLTDEGYKSIEDIQVGDKVFSHNNLYEEVVRTGMTPLQPIYCLLTDEFAPLYGTGNHPILCKDGDAEPIWKPLAEISNKDYIGTKVFDTPDPNKFMCTGSIIWFPVKSVTPTLTEADVYNLEVANTHTYTANRIIVHNCQDFSVAGKQKGAMWTCKECGHEYNPLTVHWSKRETCPKCGSSSLEVTRSSLLIEFLRMVREKKPKWGVYENVKNIVGSAFKDSFALFEKELQEYNYNTHYKIMNAKNYGVPQNRERLFLVFIRKDVDNEQFKFPEPFPLTIKLKDILEETVDDKYYMKPEKIKILAESLKEKEIKQVAQMYPDSGNPQAGRIYDSDGISPAMDTCQGGNRMPKVMVTEATKKGYAEADAYDSINLEQPNSKTRRERVGKQCAQTLTTAPQQVVVEPFGIDKTVNNTSIIEVANCITAREDKGISNRQAEGTAVVEMNVKKVGNVNPSGNGMNGNVFSVEGVAPTVTTNKGEGNKILVPDTGVLEGMIIDDTQAFDGVRLYDEYAPSLRASRSGLKTQLNYRIRKLTPKECWRLMAFPDSAVEAAKKAGISNSQLYKMAGNSIVVDCLYYIFKELYSVMPYLFDNLKVGSFFSGIGAFECALDKLQKFTEENEQPVTNTESSDKDDDAFCIAMRGRYNEDGKVEQHLEPRFDGVTNTITTVQKDNLVAVKI